jgi:aspartyl/asparaginyl beta-hydroxylase (cupin superfamily)
LPSFYDNSWFNELDILKDNWKAIRDEIIDYEKKSGNITGMGSYSPAQTSAPNAWNTINLMSYMVLYHKEREKFPVLTRLTDQIPSCTTVTISVLSPGSEIKPHYGDTNGVIRAHLGLIVPDPYPVIGMKVGDEERGWADGELLFFTIVCRHSVWSKSDKKRYVLIIDFVPKVLADRQTEICVKTLGSQTYIFLYKRIAFLRRMPEFVGSSLCSLFGVLWRVLLPIQRTFKFISPPV